MVARWRLMVWRWLHRIHDRLHMADQWASTLTHQFPDYDFPENVTYTHPVED